MSGLNQLSVGEADGGFGIVGDKAERPDVGRKAGVMRAVKPEFPNNHSAHHFHVGCAPGLWFS